MPSLAVIAMAATGLQLLALFLGVAHDVWSGGVPSNTPVLAVTDKILEEAVLESNFSCAGRCYASALSDPFNSDSSPGWCQCNPSCLQAGDCCTDYGTLCMTCKGNCGSRNDPSAVCNCNPSCARNNDCCPDYESECPVEKTVLPVNIPPNQQSRVAATPGTGPRSGTLAPASHGIGRISDTDLQELSERLFQLDNDQLGGVGLNLQGKTRSGNKNDLAPLPLFQNSPLQQWPTVTLIQKLYDNYQADVTKPEPAPANQAKEEDELLNAILATSVMKTAHSFLKSKDKAPANLQDFKNQLRSMWFTKFSRAHGNAGSSGFEHVFLGETKQGAPTGFHSWLYYRSQESGSKVNYLGYSRILSLGKAKLIEMPLSWQGLYKPLNSLLAGTTPELEMALYTVCFIIRPNARCSLSGGGNRFYVQTYVFNGRDGKQLVGTAYPYIP